MQSVEEKGQNTVKGIFSLERAWYNKKVGILKLKKKIKESSIRALLFKRCRAILCKVI